MSDKVRVDYEVTDLSNNVLVSVTSRWFSAAIESSLERQLEEDGYFDCPVITDAFEEYEQPINLMRRGCDVAGCFSWKTSVKATEYIVIYKLQRVDTKHFKLRGFCLCVCSKHNYVLKDFDWDWGSAKVECYTCSADHFSSRFRILNRFSPVCHKCRKLANDNGHPR